MQAEEPSVHAKEYGIYSHLIRSSNENQCQNYRVSSSSMYDSQVQLLQALLRWVSYDIFWPCLPFQMHQKSLFFVVSTPGKQSTWLGHGLSYNVNVNWLILCLHSRSTSSHNLSYNVSPRSQQSSVVTSTVPRQRSHRSIKDRL